MGLTHSKDVEDHSDENYVSKVSKVLLDGYCHKNYQPVKERLEEMLHDGKEENVQLCVYVDEKCVVDLYGTAIGDMSYTAETIQTIFSSGKSIESVVMGILYGKGLFKYEDPIAKHWPAFAQNGKENVTIADVFRHQGGLAWFTESFSTVKDIWTENIKQNKVGELIEKQRQHYLASTKTEYHALTRGLMINEIVRRLDAKGRTIGDIIREDFNIDGIYLGATTKANCNPVHETMLSPYKARKERQIEDQPPFCAELSGLALGQEFVNILNSPEFTPAEISSANTRANARGMAKLASIMANKGQGLMTLDAWNEMHAEPIYSFNNGMHYNFTKGGVNYFANSPDSTDIDKEKFNKNREGYYGWFGLGGSIMQWHPELKIGFAFCPTFLDITEMFNQRGAILQGIVKECAQNEKK